MKQILVIAGFFLAYTVSYSQSDVEKFPVFTDCDTLIKKELEDCFYSSLYSKIDSHYMHPQGSGLQESSKVTIRFEVIADGSFVPIRVDAIDPEIKTNMTEAINKLPVVEPPTYNGVPTYMQFVLSLPVPLVPGGVFTIYGKDDPAKPKPSIETDPVLNEYDSIENKDYEFEEYSSSAIIPLSYQRYHRFDAAMNRVGTNAHTAVKPYTYSYVNTYYDLKEENQSLYKDKTTWLGRKWWNENLLTVSGENYWLTFNLGVDLQLGKDTGENLSTYNNTRMALVSGGIGNQFSFGGTIQESQGLFADYYNREVRRRAPDGGNPGVVPGRGIAEPSGENAFDYPVSTGYISYTPSKYFNLQLGHGQQFVGDGYRSLVLSDNSMPSPYFKASANFWKMSYMALYTSMRDVRPEVTLDNSFRTKYMVHHYLSWNITKRLNLGFFESVLWENDNDRGFDFNYLNPVIFYQTIELETGSRGGNALLGITGKYKLSSNFNLYGQLVLDEFSGGAVASGNGGYQNKSGFQVGAKYFNAFQVPNLYLQFEYNSVRPYTYSHNSVILNYGNTNQALAHPWGANFKEFVIIGRYTKDRWYGIAKVIIGERGYDKLTVDDNAFYGGNIYRSEDDRVADNGNRIGQGNNTSYFFSQLEIGYLINPSSRLKVYGSIINRSTSPDFDNAVVRDESTAWINLGIRTDISNWSFDR